MTEYPPLPDVPACWGWDPLPLPQPNYPGILTSWQQERCAICAVRRPIRPRPAEWTSGLFEDHDHATGDVRGYLCPRCNTQEGASRAPVFALYRERPPTAILGLALRKGWWDHPMVREANNMWENALSELEIIERVRTRYERVLSVRRLLETGEHDTYGLRRDPILDRPLTPLMAAAVRVSLTQRGWWDSIEYRLGIQHDLSQGKPRRPHPLEERKRSIQAFS